MVASSAYLTFLAGGGETAALMQSLEWSQRALGPMASWPQSLKSALRIVFGSRTPMFVWWGEELTLLYNDAYAQMALASHPWALGRPAPEVFAEIWGEMQPQVDALMHKGQATWDEDVLLTLKRSGLSGEDSYTFACSPIPDGHGSSGGILATAIAVAQSGDGERQQDEAGEIVEWIGSATDITARKRAEEALRDSEERLRLAIQAGNIFTWDVDPETRQVTYSDNVKEVMGFSLQENTSSDRDLVYADDRAFVVEHYLRALRGEADYNIEHRFVAPQSGEIVWVRAQGHLVEDAQSGKARFIGVTQNISERIEVEQALRRYDEEFKAHFNLTTVGNVQADAASGRFLLVNRAMCDFTGYPETELLERTIWDITDPQHRAENEKLFSELVHGERASFELEKRFIRKDGEVRWGVVCVTVAQRDEAGSPLRTGSVVLDITKRKAAEERLRQLNETLERHVEERTAQVRESEARFRALVDASAQIVWTMNAQGRVVEDSPSWRQFTGQSYDEGKGWGWMDAVHPDDRERTIQHWLRSVVTTVPMNTEFRVHHVSGEWHWMQVRAVPLQDEHGAVRGWVGMNIDINERKQAEADRERLTRSLMMAEQEERRRISQVLHDDLQQLLYATQMRIAMIGQDLRAAGQVSLMEEMEEARAWLKQCVETTRQMTVDLSPPILKNEGLADALEWLQPQMEQRHGLKIVINTQDNFRIVDEDMRALLFQIVRELLFNVAKHAGVERAVIELGQEEDHLVIHVVDEGLGFDMREVSERKKQKGGFGLFSVQERLRLVGGRLEIRSRLGSGTHIVIHAPVQAERLR